GIPCADRKLQPPGQIERALGVWGDGLGPGATEQREYGVAIDGSDGRPVRQTERIVDHLAIRFIVVLALLHVVVEPREPREAAVLVRNELKLLRVGLGAL